MKTSAHRHVHARRRGAAVASAILGTAGFSMVNRMFPLVALDVAVDLAFVSAIQSFV